MANQHTTLQTVMQSSGFTIRNVFKKWKIWFWYFPQLHNGVPLTHITYVLVMLIMYYYCFMGEAQFQGQGWSMNAIIIMPITDNQHLHIWAHNSLHEQKQWKNTQAFKTRYVLNLHMCVVSYSHWTQGIHTSFSLSWKFASSTKSVIFQW